MSSWWSIIYTVIFFASGVIFSANVVSSIAPCVAATVSAATVRAATVSAASASAATTSAATVRTATIPAATVRAATVSAATVQAAATVVAAVKVAAALFGYSNAQSRQITSHGSPNTFSGGGVGGSFRCASVLCAKRKR